MFFESVPSVSPAEAADRMASGWMLLDVRSDGEWTEARIPGAVHVPMNQLTDRLQEVADRVICVCAVGARSARVAQFLLAQGYEAVNLAGGIYAWADDGRPIES
jgi:rhodanese-related sulfurtransferase